MYQQDRRQIVRWQIDRQAKLKLQDETDAIDCQVQDMNLLGCKLVISREIGQDQYVKINLSFSDEYTFDMEVWVAWHRVHDGHNVYGVYFAKLKDVDKERMYQFIHQCIPEKLRQQWWKGLDQMKGEETMEDRRIFSRFSAQFPMRLLTLANGREVQAQSQDICAKGIGVSTNEPLVPESQLELWLELPDRGEPLYARGEVVWSKPAETGGYRAGINLEKANLMGLGRALRCVLPK